MPKFMHEQSMNGRCLMKQYSSIDYILCIYSAHCIHNYIPCSCYSAFTVGTTLSGEYCSYCSGLTCKYSSTGTNEAPPK